MDRAPHWTDRAACRSYPNPEHFFNMSGPDGRDYLAISSSLQSLCAACPVRRVCRSRIDALEKDKSRSLCHGFWAGETVKQRLRRRKKRRDRAKTRNTGSTGSTGNNGSPATPAQKAA